MSVNVNFKGVHYEDKVKLTVKDPLNSSIFNKGLLEQLRPHNGVIFPYTPTIQVSHGANYGTYDIPHSVTQSHYFMHTPNPTISIQATFTAQDAEDGIYSAAALQFFKSMTKMDFGTSGRIGGTAGAPPPVLLFSAYGGLNFRNVPVVIKNFNYGLSEEPDYVSFEESTIGKFSVPTLWIASLELGVQITPNVQKSFNVREYRDGSLLRKGGWA